MLRFDWGKEGMEQDVNGDWVEYLDANARILSLEAQLAQAKEWIRDLRESLFY